MDWQFAWIDPVVTRSRLAMDANCQSTRTTTVIGTTKRISA